MKARAMILTAVTALALMATGASGQTKYVPKPDEELYGTWTNEQNTGDLYHPQKLIVSSNKITMYYRISDRTPTVDGDMTWKIDSKWTDSDGNVWYKTYGTHTAGIYKGYSWQELDKVSKSGKVWERALSPLGNVGFDPAYYPTSIDPRATYYRILYRSAQ